MNAWVVIIPDVCFFIVLFDKRGRHVICEALGDNLDSPSMTSTDHCSVLREAHQKTHKF